MSRSSLEHIDKLDMILYDRPAGRNVIGHAIVTIQKLRSDLAAARADADAVRELMNCYNVGGWTDADGPMKRALKAEADLAAARALLKLARSEVELWTPDECNCTITDAVLLNQWYALRDRIDAAIAGQRREGE